MGSNNTTTSAENAFSSDSDRLDSWKDIAVYLKRDVRTVRRWEEKEHLPVHRHLHSKRGSVYASKAELDAWWNQGGPRVDVPSRPAAAGRPLRWVWPIALVVALVLVTGLYFVRQRSASISSGRLRLLVLPFDNLSGDPGQEYLSDGITEEVITQLGRSQPEGLALIARTSAMQYKQLHKGVGEIGREMNADLVLEGSVRTGGGRVRIAAQLIRVRDETHLWAEEYDRELRDILGLQSDVSQAVAQQIRLKLTAPLPAKAVRTNDPEAFELYLKGRYVLNRRTGGRELARKYFQDAIDKDPTFADAYAGLAESLVRIAFFGPTPSLQAWGDAEAAAGRALELDETLPAAHSVMAGIRLYHDWNFAEAQRENLRAIALNPNDANAHAGYANLLQSLGLTEEAILERRRALELEPLRVDLATWLGREYVFARKYDEAIKQFKEALQLDNRYAPAVDGLADVYARKGMYLESASEQVRLLNLKQQSETAATFDRIHAAAGYVAAARMLDEKALENYRKRPAETNSWNVAFTYARLGDRKAALQWLEKAYAMRDPGLLLILVDPDVDTLRSDPRFEDLVRRMHFPPPDIRHSH